MSVNSSHQPPATYLADACEWRSKQKNTTLLNITAFQGNNDESNSAL